jgi:hypothetical protein
MARRRPGLVAGLLLGALLAFPAGLMLGRGEEPAAGGARRAAPAGDEGLRNPYSPNLLGDPAFLAGQRRNAKALEAQCRESGEFCAEAEAIRRWLEEGDARD